MAVKSKKKWIKIIALYPFNEQYIGETFVSDIENAFGKKINLSLMNLTNDPKRQNIRIHFEITKKHKDCVAAEMVGYSLVASSIRRLVRRNCNRIDESYVFITKDNKKVKLKPLILTRAITKGSVLKVIRKSIKEFLLNMVSNSTYEDLINSLLHYKLQKEMRISLKKIYPLKVCEIKVMKLEKPKKGFEKGSETKEKPEEQAKEWKIENPKESTTKKSEKEKEEKTEENSKRDYEGPGENKEAKKESAENKKELKEKKARI